MNAQLNRLHLLQASAIALLAPNLPAFGTPIPQLDFPIEDVCHAALALFDENIMQPPEGADFGRHFDPRPARFGDVYDLDGRNLPLNHLYVSFSIHHPTPPLKEIITNYVLPGVCSMVRSVRQPGLRVLACRPLIQDNPCHGVRQHEEFNDGISLTLTVAFDYIEHQHLFTIEGLFATDPELT